MQQNNSRYLWIVIESRIVALAALGIRRSHTETYNSLHNSNYDHVLHDHISIVSISQAKYEFQNCHKFLWQIIKQRATLNRDRVVRSIVDSRYNWTKHAGRQSDEKKIRANCFIKYQAIAVTSPFITRAARYTSKLQHMADIINSWHIWNVNIMSFYLHNFN